MKKKYLNKLVKICIILVITFYIISCEGEDKGTGEAKKAKPADVAVVQEQEDRGDSKQTSSVAEAVVSKPEGRDFLLYSESFQEAVFPEDYEIGPLQTVKDAGGAEILEVAEQFLEGLEKGSIEEKLLAPLKKDFVLRILNKNLEKAVPVDNRIGMINYSDDPAWAEIRLFGSEGAGEGVMYFVRENGWKIYDMHLDFSDLGEPPEEGSYGDGEFDPIKKEKM